MTRRHVPGALWLRVIGGLILCTLGLVWVLQGFNVLHGSQMSGHHQYAALGLGAFVVGAALLVWAARS